MRGEGRDLDHRKAVEEERGLSEYSCDYCFPGDEFGFKHTILVGREKTSGMLMAATVPTKGTCGKFAVDKLQELITECGDSAKDIIVKTDQEPAVKFLMKDLVDSRESGRTIVEEAPVGSKGSNGIVERAAQTVEGQIRVMKSALEGRLRRRIGAMRRRRRRKIGRASCRERV